MVIEGKVHYVVHSKLEPPEVYISLEEPLPPETAKILLEVGIQMKAAEEDARNILEEAASVAEREIKKRYSNFGKVVDVVIKLPKTFLRPVSFTFLRFSPYRQT